MKLLDQKFTACADDYMWRGERERERAQTHLDEVPYHSPQSGDDLNQSVIVCRVELVLKPLQQHVLHFCLVPLWQSLCHVNKVQRRVPNTTVQ